MFSPGVRYMLASALAFSVMSALVKTAGARLPAQEVVLARAVVSLVLSYGLLVHARVPLFGNDKRLLFLRGLFGFAALACYYYAVTRLPLAAATTIQHLHPVLAAPLAAVVLHERVGWVLSVAIALSFAGLVLVSKPAALFSAALALDTGDVLIAVAGSFFTASAYVIVRRLAKTEHPLVIVFYFPLVTIPLSLPMVVPVWVTPTGWEWIVLLGVGVATQIGQVMLTHGFMHETAARGTALSYMQVPFAMLWGLLFFAEEPDVWTLAGAALILAGTFVNIRMADRRLAPKPQG